MPVVRFPVRELERLLGKKVPRDVLAKDIPMLGADVDDVSGETWAIEFFPDRPDLFTVEGLARALRAWYGVAPGLCSYDVAAPRHELRVDRAAVEKVRPHIAGAYVRGVEVTAERLESLIALQEDLHWGLGARRRKVAIGVHDAAALVPPFTYTAVGLDAIRFVPLAAEPPRPMTPREILAKHPKGTDYAHLVGDKAALITDAKEQVLSFPPIINGRLTTVTTASRDLFVDVTGWDAVAVRKALNLIVTSLAEAGGRIEAIRVLPEGGVSPDLAPERRSLDVAAVNAFLGTSFDAAAVVERLRRAGHGARPAGARVEVEVPAYRVDILHDVDVMEDVAVGHGFNAFEPALPRAVTYGRQLPGAVVAERARRALTGLGFLETMALSLSNDVDQFERMGLAVGDAVRVKNPVSEEHDLLRPAILPSLLAILRKNAHRDYPQRLFEIAVATLPRGGEEPVTERRVAGVVAHARSSFTEVKGIALALARDLGWPANVAPAEHASYIRGRVASLGPPSGSGGSGVFGELAPGVVDAFGIPVPVAGFEFALGR
ncbi:MAG TPA: phenylalanine--tRNA ligase subunit beta [Candidatus Thermoplasmatota archaeon]|nr:phenylalanine--tRNA ligase subunit beta [Candidatus Thermoplasmatota archaeon]